MVGNYHKNLIKFKKLEIVKKSIIFINIEISVKLAKDKIDIEIVKKIVRQPKNVSSTQVNNPVLRPISNRSKLHFKALKLELDAKKVKENVPQKTNERNLSANNNYYKKFVENKLVLITNLLRKS
jgi:hypothetical protein